MRAARENGRRAFSVLFCLLLTTRRSCTLLHQLASTRITRFLFPVTSLTPDHRSRVILDVDAGRSAPAARPEPDRPFNILVIGDFSGAAARPTATDPAELRGRRVFAVDRDNVDDVLAALRPSVQFSLASDAVAGAGAADGPSVSINFQSLDDFHPDRLIANVALLLSLDDLREEASEGRLTSALRAESSSSASAPVPNTPALSNPRGGSLLDQIVESSAASSGAGDTRNSGARAERAPDPSDLHAYIRHILKPHMVAQADTRTTALVAQIEDTIATVLRAILHHAGFQALESLWRGLAFLVHRLETGARLKVYMVDVSAAEVAADLAPDRPLESSFVGRLLLDGADAGAAGAAPFAVVSALYTFGDSAEGVALLTRLAALAHRANAALLAAAAPSLAGLKNFATEVEPGDVKSPSREEWRSLRQSGDARFAGLAMPRFVLRAPYDPREEPCERVAFQEMMSPPLHEHYLWGNPAIICALLLGEAFNEAGWQMQPGSALEVGGLPVHLYRAAGTTEAKPCAEALLTDRVAGPIMQLGVMPMLSMKGGDAVRLARFQSIADPPSALAGPWSIPE